MFDASAISDLLDNHGYRPGLFDAFLPAKGSSLPALVKLRPCVANIIKLFPSGNRIGHQPDSPRFPIINNPYSKADTDDKTKTDDLGSSRRSAFIYEVDDALRDSYFFPKMLEDLGFHNDGRQRKSERREAVVSVLQVLVHYLSPSMKVGFPPRSAKEAAEIGFTYYDREFIAAKAGISLSRLKEVIKLLVDKGYIKRKRRFAKSSGGQYKGVTSTTVLTDKLFKKLGLVDKWRKYYDWAYSKAKKAAAKIGVKIGTFFSSKIFSIDELITEQGTKPADYPETDARHWYALLRGQNLGIFQVNIADIKQNSPDLSDAEVYKRAYELTIS